MEPTKLISLADFHKIQFVAARIASVKVNKTARVPAYLCSLELGTPLMEVDIHRQMNAQISLVNTPRSLKQDHISLVLPLDCCGAREKTTLPLTSNKSHFGRCCLVRWQLYTVTFHPGTCRSISVCTARVSISAQHSLLHNTQRKRSMARHYWLLPISLESR